MKRFVKCAVSLVLVAVFAFVLVAPAAADKPVSFDSQGNEVGWQKSNCANIQSGTITDAAGIPITVGFDRFGYNYQAHEFNGTYASSDRVDGNGYWGDTTSPWINDSLEMKWSDDWLANVDCNGDHKLDRGLVNWVVGGTSLGWTTNHVQGQYLGDDGNMHTYTDFVKIQYTGPGSPLWGSYTVVQEVYNDQYSGYHGLLTKTDPGLGHNLGE